MKFVAIAVATLLQSASLASAKSLEQESAPLRKRNQSHHKQQQRHHAKGEEGYKPYLGLANEDEDEQYGSRRRVQDMSMPMSMSMPEMCSFCSLGVTNPDIVLIGPGSGISTTCEVAASVTMAISASDPLCAQTLQAEFLCCPEIDEAATNTGTGVAPEIMTTSCSFCPDGMADPDFVLDTETGTTCGTTASSAALLSEDDAFCSMLLMGQLACCPEEPVTLPVEPEPLPEPCHFCQEGFNVPADTLLPTDDGATCETAAAFASSVQAGQSLCETVKLAEQFCCTGEPPVTETPIPVTTTEATEPAVPEPVTTETPIPVTLPAVTEPVTTETPIPATLPAATEPVTTELPIPATLPVATEATEPAPAGGGSVSSSSKSSKSGLLGKSAKDAKAKSLKDTPMAKVGKESSSKSGKSKSAKTQADAKAEKVSAFSISGEAKATKLFKTHDKESSKSGKSGKGSKGSGKAASAKSEKATANATPARRFLRSYD